MSNHYALTRRALVAAGAAVGLGLSQGALADTADDSLEITAGLVEALTLSCDTALSFGITRLANLATRTQTSTVILDRETGDLTTTDTDLQTGQGSLGSCTMSGSAMPDGSVVGVLINDEIGSGIDGVSVTLSADADAFGELTAPGTPLTNLTVGGFDVPLFNNMDANGDYTFDIGATLTIPGTVNAANLGGYSNTVTVSVDDGFSSGEGE